MFKPRSFLLYILAILTSFFAGLIVAGLLEAGKHQGLAGGAIVLGYGVVGAGIGLVLALLTAWKANQKVVSRLNIVLGLLVLACFVYFHLKYQERQQTRSENAAENEVTIPAVRNKRTGTLIPQPMNL